MIQARLAHRMAQLVSDREAFVVATVVQARRPTSVRPGDTAVVLADGTIDGFVGGMCAESSVRLYSLRALETGEPLLLRLVPGHAGPGGDGGGGDRAGGDGAGGDGAGPDGEGARADGALDGADGLVDGAVIERNPCLSGGSLEIFLEPHLPAPSVIVCGGSPTAEALQRLGDAAGYAVSRSAAGDEPDLSGAAALIVASHGGQEEQVLGAALTAGVPYVGLVASRRRGAAVREALEVAPELAAQLHTPAGLDIGARTPAEIAISILAELVAEHHADPAPGRPNGVTATATATVTASDPICGMRVPVAPATPHLHDRGERIWFCGAGCRAAYAAAHGLDAASP